MTNPTSNYGFVLPNSADLVTDLPADFDVALQGVDTRLKALQPGTTLGDLAFSSATANTNTRVPIGTTGQVLAVVAGVPAWQNGTTGDIEGVTAGTGISGGGTSGTVTVTNSMATAITTAGDLIKGTGSGTFDRLGIGSTGQVLTVAAGVPSWATAAAGGGLTSIASGSLSGSSLDLTSISGSYKNLQLTLRDYYPSSNAAILLRLNGVSSASAYTYLVNMRNSQGASSVGDTGTEMYFTYNSVTAADNNNAAILNIWDYSNTTAIKVMNWTSAYTSPSPIIFALENSAGVFRSTTNAITQITLSLSSGTFSGGTYILYGVN